MPKERCPYCHEYIESSEMAAHEAAHRELQEDGQQADYVTLPEDEREQGDLDGEPTVYIHRVCGEATEMPDDIVRSYLVNPYLYLADATFCCGCGKHVPLRECVWMDTGEDLQTH